jgi:GT2 family glycosyltransferase
MMTVREHLHIARGKLLFLLLKYLRILSKPLGMRERYHGIVLRLVRKTQLFDRSYYLDMNPDVASGNIKPLKHYVIWGDREGRQPMPFFDPVYYRSNMPGLPRYVNTLLHYHYIGRHLRVSASPWFDTEFYLSQNKDVLRSGINPLYHYLAWGGLEGRSPSPHFDGVFYLKTNPDVVEARINPLLHYLLFGRYEGRSITATVVDEYDETENGTAPQPVVPLREAWRSLKSRAACGEAVVDVIVPVYKGYTETLQCLYSVLAAETTVSFELIVINDAGPEQELSEEMRVLAAAGLFTLLENQKNKGFVHTVNRGMDVHVDRDIVLLNSDTQVYDQWLDRLHAAAFRNPTTGTVTPLSNNATICSYPRFLHDNPYPLEMPYHELNSLTAEINAGVEVEAPTGVGFCMYIRRDCLQQVGLFDEKTFGHGYGEENDFCQRALRHGWRNIIAADTFVRHWGAASFQGEKAKRVQVAQRTLDKLHPRYHRDVADFIAADPLATARQRLDWHRLLRLRSTTNILIVTHNRGGGVERHVQDEAQALTQAGASVFILRPVPKNKGKVMLRHYQAKSLANLQPYDLSDADRLCQDLQTLGIHEIHTHSFVDMNHNAPAKVADLVQCLGARLKVTLHDYKVICPRINLADEQGRYCGEPDEAVCNRCLRERGNDFGVSDIRAWRNMRHRKLRAADTILVPDQDMADRLTRYYPDVTFTVTPHELLDQECPALEPISLQQNEKIRIVVIGAIGKIKGFDVLQRCVADAAARRLPIEFSVLGYSMNDALLNESGCSVTGKYQEHEALVRLKALRPHLVWLPSLWPETYSYTLSIALQGGYPVAAFDIGAIAARLRRLQRTSLLMPLDLAKRPEHINDHFVRYAQAGDTDNAA